jgi:hypothetical protein
VAERLVMIDGMTGVGNHYRRRRIRCVAIHSLIPEDAIKEDGPRVAACARRKASSQTTCLCATFRQRLIKRDWRFRPISRSNVRLPRSGA